MNIRIETKYTRISIKETRERRQDICYEEKDKKKIAIIFPAFFLRGFSNNGNSNNVDKQQCI